MRRSGSPLLAYYVFIQITTFSAVKACIVSKTSLLSQSEVSIENRHFKSVFTQINGCSVVIACQRVVIAYS